MDNSCIQTLSEQNMKKIVCLLCLCMTLTAFHSCSEEETQELSDIALIITPSPADSIVLQSGDRKLFNMKYYVNTGGKVERLQVKSVDVENGELTLADTTYAETVQEATFIYVAPQTTRERLSVKLTFTITETSGRKTTQTRTVTVNSRLLMLQEVGPVVLYMASDKADAIMFNEPTQVFDHVLEAESRLPDLYLDVDTLEDGTHPLAFMSGTETRFVRANSFDYASASANAIQTVYANSVRMARIDALQTNDIIIAGHGAQAEGIMFIQNIVRTGTDNELCLQMRYKPLHKVTEENIAK